jgi:hypothetical protein
VKISYDFGPFKVDVDMSLGRLSPLWGGPEVSTYALVLRDAHGHFFEAAWSDFDEEGPEGIAQRLVILMERAMEERNFAEAFAADYRGKEGSWRRREAYRIKEAVQEFIPAEVTKAAAIAIRKLNYRIWKGPRDWSPIEEIPGE